VETLSNFTFTNLPSRTVRVCLPRGYNENAARRYPVLYMHDGQNLFQGMAGLSGYSWNADTNAASLIRFGEVRELIIVGVDSSAVGATRIAEYKPPECGGIGDKYAALLIQELKPYMDAHYRTLPDADNTGAWGSSMGGLISTYLGWTFPGTFRKIGAMSTAFWQCAATGDNLAVAPKRPLRVYLDSGDVDQQNFSSDGVALTFAARDNLLNNGYVLNVDLDHVVGYNQNHSEQWWCALSPRCFTFLFPTADEPNTILDAAAPLRITAFRLTNNTCAVTWPGFRSRIYSLEGSTNTGVAAAMNWSNVVNTAPESRPWNYPTATATNVFHFFRVVAQPVTNW
jgi:predicted alpha/beta superfamily hydrolase